MSEMPTGYAESGSEEAATSGRAWRLPGHRSMVALAVAGGIILMLLDALGVHLAFPGAFTLTGIMLIGAGAVYAFSATPEAISRSPLAAAHALMALPDPCFVMDRRGAVLFANEAYRSLAGGFGADRPQPLERLMAGRDEAAEVVFRLAQAARTGFAAEEDVKLGFPGAERNYKAIVRPLSGRDGSVWLLRDLTGEREKTSHAEHAYERAMLHIGQAPFGFLVAADDGRFLFLNERLAGWLGVGSDHAVQTGMKIADVASGDVDFFADQEKDESGELMPLDLDFRAADGTTIPVRIWRNHTPVPGEDGGRMLALVLRRHGEGDESENAREATLRFARFFNNAPIGIATVDMQGRISNANRAFVSYMAGEKVEQGVPVISLLAEEDRPSVNEALERAFDRNGKGIAAPVDVHLASNPEKVAQLYTARFDTGNEAAAAIYLIDATEQKSLELQFSQSQKMQAVGQLAGGVAHDFNNLLTAIIGFCDLLLARHQAGDPSFADVVQIKQNANRAANLTRQLLAFSRRQTLRPKVLSLTDAIAELQNLLARLLTEKVDFRIVHGRDLGLVKVDQNQLEQVIINLAVNARDAMPEGGRLTIRTANVSEDDSRALDHPLMPHGEYVLIEVADTGLGIPKENLGKIFEPFYTTKDPSKGTGLGLSTVYGIVKQTGGFIFPYSTVGKGTTFRIYLPRHIEVVQEKSAEEVPAQVSAAAADLTGKGTILLVEDEDAVRTFASRALQTRGYDVLQAESGEVALEVVKNHEGRIDLVVSDVVMPNMDGPTMAKVLKDILPDTPIIFVSGYAEDAFAKNLDPDQEFHFLPKPFSLKQLAAAVKEVLG